MQFPIDVRPPGPVDEIFLNAAACLLQFRSFLMKQVANAYGDAHSRENLSKNYNPWALMSRFSYMDCIKYCSPCILGKFLVIMVMTKSVVDMH